MTDRIRTLTEEGISGFRCYIEAVRRGDEVDWPIDLLTDDATSTAFPQAGQIDDRGFGSKYELADYISQRLSGLPSESVDYNQGLWGWLALYYFPHLCPPDDDGKQNPLKEQLYIPPKVDQPLAYRTYYRHLIAGPYRIRQLHGQESQALLWGPIDKHPDLLEQLAARQDLITNKEFIKAVVQLYFCREGNGAWSPKRGAVTRTRPGNLRRLKELLDQLDRTCDLYGLTAEQFLDLLPDEYAQWRRSA